MAEGFVLDIKNLSNVLSRLDKMDASLRQEVDDELTVSAENVARNAKRNFQVLTAGFSSLANRKTYKIKRSTGTLLNRINANTKEKYRKEVVAQARYAPYVEFGTGGLVEVPAGLEAYAAQFKGRGQKRVNLPARPFLFPALAEEKPKLTQRIANLLLMK